MRLKVIRRHLLLGLAILGSAGRLLAGPVEGSVDKEPIRVACVGDSITAGFGAGQGNGYPEQLARMLGGKWHVRNFGVSGTTVMNQGDSPYQQTPAFTNALAFEPHVVVIKLGTNDTKPRNWKFKDGFVAEYTNLIARFTQSCTAR